jgi:hypothetical protein
MFERRRYEIAIPRIKSLEELYGLEIIEVAEGAGEKISYMVYGDTLYSMIYHLDLMFHIKEYFRQKGFFVSSTSAGDGLWSASVRPEDRSYEIEKTAVSEHEAMVKILDEYVEERL